MLSIKNWKEFIFDYEYEKEKIQRRFNWQLDLYINLLMTVGLTPIFLIVDLLIFPFEVGYLIFKKIINKRFGDLLKIKDNVDLKELVEKKENKEEQDYIQEYNDFWKDIVENEDGTLNKDQVMRELSDYSMVMDNCARAYCLMTHSRISKQNTMFFEVENIFYDLFIDKDIVIDDMSEILKINDIDELKKKIRDYFDIGDSNEH